MEDCARQRQRLWLGPSRRKYVKNRKLVLVSVAVVLCLVASVAGSAQSVPNWAPNVAYSVGSLVMFQGVEYKCIQAHTSQSDWTPPATPALWQPVSGSPNSDTDAGANTHTNAESDSYTQPRWRRV